MDRKTQFIYLQELYDNNRFMEAYDNTKDLWKAKSLEGYNCEELVFAARLASKLGNDKVRRWILRELKKSHPDNPLVIYYASFDSRELLLDQLQENSPQLTNDERISSNWNLKRAVQWSDLRDWEKVKSYLQKAKELDNDRDWLTCTEAYLYMQEGEWEKALDLVLDVWKKNPGMPFCASLLGSLMFKLNRSDEALDLLYSSAEKAQSYDVIRTCIWYMIAKAESCRDAKESLLPKIKKLIAVLKNCTPLADRDCQYAVAMTEIDFAFLTENYDEISRLESLVKQGFYNTVCKNSSQNAEKTVKILDIVPVYQKHNTCLTSSISTVLQHWGDHYSDDYLAQELCFGGTSAITAEKWLRDKNYLSQFFTLTPENLRSVIDAGAPIIVSLYGESISHAVVIIGYNDILETVVIHDPSSLRQSHYLIDFFFEIEAPLGPRAMLVLPQAQEKIIDSLDNPSKDLMNAKMKFWSDLRDNGLQETKDKYQTLLVQYKDQPIAKLIQAELLSQDSLKNEAKDIYKNLIEEFPDSREIRSAYIDSLHDIGNYTKVLLNLKELVEYNKLPNVNLDKEIFGNKINYICQYADILNRSSRNRDKAIKSLRKALKDYPSSGELYHSLADIYISKCEYQKALAPARAAATIYEENTHYATTYSNILRWLGREADGLEFLRERAHEQADNKQSWRAWFCYIDTLEDYGKPQEALDTLDTKIEQFQDDSYALLYAVKFYLRRGLITQANKALKSLQDQDNKLAYYEAAYKYYDALGEKENAFAFCSKYIELNPDSMTLKNAYLQLLGDREGEEVMLLGAKKWREEHPEDIDYHMLEYEINIDLNRRDKAIEILKNKLTINAYSDWDNRELFHKLLEDYQAENNDKRADLFTEIKDIRNLIYNNGARCSRSLVIFAEFAEIEGKVDEAIDYYKQALELDPDYTYIYGQLWELSNYQCQNHLNKILKENPIAQPYCYSAYRLFAADLGVDIALQDLYNLMPAEYWPPYMYIAEAQLLLYYGEGVSDAEKALVIIDNALIKFPLNYRLKCLQIEAYDACNKEEHSIECLKSLNQLYPNDTYCLKELAQHYLYSDFPLSSEYYQKAIKIEPRDGQLRTAYAKALKEKNQLTDAIAILQKALEFIPMNIGLRKCLMFYAIENQNKALAIQVAEDGISLYPDGSYLWYLYGNVLSDTSKDLNKITAAYLKALELNPRLSDAIDELAILYVEAADFKKAMKIVQEQIALNPKEVRMQWRMAWILIKQQKIEDAYIILSKELTKEPRYEWAWRLMIHVLRELNDSDKTQKVLIEKWPCERVKDIQVIRMLRLNFLIEKDIQAGKCENEWKQLIKDFPRDLELVLKRFDMQEEKRTYDAVKLLQEAEPLHHGNALISARLFPHLFNKESSDQLVARCLNIWRDPYNEDSWAANYVWSKLEGNTELKNIIITELKKLFDNGEYFVPCIFHHYLTDRLKPIKQKAKLIQYCEEKIISPLEEIKEWNTELHKEAFLRILGNVGYDQEVITLFEKHPSLNQGGNKVWQQYAHVKMYMDPKSATQLMHGWQDTRRDLNMFVMQNYIYFNFSELQNHYYFAKGKTREVLKNSKDALELLVHDYTCAYIARVYCTALIESGDYENFSHQYEKYMHYIHGNADDFYESPVCEYSKVFLSSFYRTYKHTPIDSPTDEIVQEYKPLLKADFPCAKKHKKTLIKLMEEKDRSINFMSFYNVKEIASLIFFSALLINALYQLFLKPILF